MPSGDGFRYGRVRKLRALKMVGDSIFIAAPRGKTIPQHSELQWKTQCRASSSAIGEASQGASEDNRDTAVIINTTYSFFISIRP